ncbi:MAG: helix-turn-helix transcriptional regulator [Erysipelotrichaceae bacterium]|nr:helix-turn-helix transcriptional regulator [Erysipelotrichaceae bacterium]MCR4952220.1 helix-turn-helix domain-containing protein [Solobacterium sp.]
MNLKEYCKTNRISVKKMSLSCGIAYSTLNDLINGKTDPDRASFGMIRKIAAYLGLDMNAFCELFPGDSALAGNQPASGIMIRNKSYYLLWRADRIYLCKVTALNDLFIHDIASWKYNELETKRKLEEANDLLLNARK